jgi:hypothetical protein
MAQRYWNCTVSPAVSGTVQKEPEDSHIGFGPATSRAGTRVNAHRRNLECIQN